jgi:hypothetical protein
LFFLADSCLVIFFERNILDFDLLIHSYISQKPVSIISIFVIAFLFINHFLFRIVRHAIISYIVIPIHCFIYIPYIQRDFSRPDGFRNISSVKFQAIRKRDEFTLKRAEQQEDAYFKMEQFDGEIFTFVCLLCINVWVVGSPANPTISQYLINFLEENTGSLLGNVLYIAFYAIIFLFIWIAVQGLIPNKKEMYAPRIEKKPSYPATV